MIPLRARVPDASRSVCRRAGGGLLVRALTAGSVAALIGLTPGTVSGQQAPGLDAVERLSREGRTAEARASLSEWWTAEHDRARRPEQQRALWLRGLLTPDPEQAMLDYQRLVVLYPGGPYTGRALLRLAQVEHVLGRADAAREHVEALARDYPRSPVRREAEAWFRAAPPAGVPVTAPAEEARPPAEEARGDRPGAVPAEAGGDSSSVGGPGPVTASEGERFVVQVGAFGDPERARAARAELVDSGFSARIVEVEGSDLLHVRVGAFLERAMAEDLLARLEAAGLGGVVVRDGRRERPVPR